jgi:hypothetical protein
MLQAHAISIFIAPPSEDPNLQRVGAGSIITQGPWLRLSHSLGAVVTVFNAIVGDICHA